MESANEVFAVGSINWSLDLRTIFELSVITCEPSAKYLQVGRIYRNIIFESYKQTLIRVERFNVIKFPNQLVANRNSLFTEFYTLLKIFFVIFTRDFIVSDVRGQLSSFFESFIGILDLLFDINFG